MFSILISLYNGRSYIFPIFKNFQISYIDSSGTFTPDGIKYISDKFYWDEGIYRNNLDTITIEYKEKIYFVSISQDSTLIGLDQNNEFFFHESLLIGEPIDVVQCEFTNSLTLLLGQCISKNIIFKFHKDDSGINHIFHENGRLIVYLNNLERSELDKTKILITNKIKELQ